MSGSEASRPCTECGALRTFNITSAARLMGLSPRTVFELCRSGKLGFIRRGKIGKTIPYFEIERYERENLIHNGRGATSAYNKKRRA